ncbi:MAG: GtrA family protein [Clostridia bacterium]|jgi:putative flippase GtrA|nr:GtrA family protein [Clostridia bacterium]
MELIKKLIKKFCTREFILYILFGIFTTIVNIGSFYIMTNYIHLEENLSNVISTIIAVLLAYFTNRKLVFNSQAISFNEKLNEFSKFILGRVTTMIIEFIGFSLLFDILHIQELISKTIITIFVIILNFFISKFFAFKN